MKGIITINTNAIVQLSKEGGELLWRPEAREQLIKFLKLEKFIQELKEQIKKKIVESALQLMPEAQFTGIKDPEISCLYRAYGGKYQITDQQMAMPFLKKEVRYVIDTKKVEDYIRKNGTLPEGIAERERSKTLSISLKEEKNGKTEDQPEPNKLLEQK